MAIPEKNLKPVPTFALEHSFYRHYLRIDPATGSKYRSLGLIIPDAQTSPADFDYAYDLAKRLTRINGAKAHFEYNCQFWDSIFSKAQRSTSREVFRQLEDRMARYYPLLLKLFPTARPSEILMEMYRKGKIAEAFRAFKKIYLEIVGEVIDHLKIQDVGDSSA